MSSFKEITEISGLSVGLVLTFICGPQHITGVIY